MTTLMDRWRIDVVAQGDRMVAAAMEHLDDANEARLVVHEVLAQAMDNMASPNSRRELDTALGLALRIRASRG